MFLCGGGKNWYLNVCLWTVCVHTSHMHQPNKALIRRDDVLALFFFEE